MNPATLPLLIPIVVMICVFTFLSIVAWAERYTKEREAFYRADLLKKLADASTEGAQQVLGMIREEAEKAERKRLDGMRLGGLINVAVGIGLTIMLGLLERGGWLWSIGMIPFLIGAALLLHVHVILPRTPRVGAHRSDPQS